MKKKTRAKNYQRWMQMWKFIVNFSNTRKNIQKKNLMLLAIKIFSWEKLFSHRAYQTRFFSSTLKNRFSGALSILFLFRDCCLWDMMMKNRTYVEFFAILHPVVVVHTCKDRGERKYKISHLHKVKFMITRCMCIYEKLYSRSYCSVYVVCWGIC